MKDNNSESSVKEARRSGKGGLFKRKQNDSIENNIDLIGRERLSQAIQLEEDDKNEELAKA